MPERSAKRTLCLLIVLLTFSSCMNREFRTYRKSLSDGRYDTEFPSGDAAPAIAALSRSEKKIYSVSHYTTWQFDRSSRILRYQVSSGEFRKLAVGTISTQETVVGTGTIMLASEGRVALLTCAHVVESPDTLISWYDPANEDQLPVVRSISIREKQENWVRDLGDCGPFTVLASDPADDIAILGRRCTPEGTPPTVFPCLFGHSEELEWGTFVYIFGYPMGNPVVTKALVSKPNGGDTGDFTVDALLNKGFSGGIILAIRDGVPNFELVGMVKSVSSGDEYYLRPASDDKKYYEIFPYRGDVFVGSRELVSYGINFTVPTGKILSFYNRNRDELLRQGFNLDAFFGLTLKNSP